MNTSTRAEDHVRRKAERKFKKTFLRPSPTEEGFDFRDEEGRHFIEVKGTTRSDLKKVHFRTLTEAEYGKARDALNSGLRYQLVIVTGVGTPQTQSHWYEADAFVPLAKEGRHYTVPIAKLRSSKASQPARWLSHSRDGE